SRPHGRHPIPADASTRPPWSCSPRAPGLRGRSALPISATRELEFRRAGALLSPSLPPTGQVGWDLRGGGVPRGPWHAGACAAPAYVPPPPPPQALALCPPYAIFFEGSAALVFGFLPGCRPESSLPGSSGHPSPSGSACCDASPVCSDSFLSSVSSAFNSPMSVSSLMTATSRWQHRELLVPVAPLLFPAGLRSPEMAESLKLKGYQEVMDTMVMPWTHDNNYKDYNGMDEEESCDDYLL
ncbi:unnamed protein product, partial [Urochloa humidicola]